MKNPLRKSQDILRKWALAFPDAKEDYPWEFHSAIKVKGKTFVFIALVDDELSLSVKLPFAGKSALSLPFAAPTQYGLGKSGWVTARFGPKDKIPLELLQSWIEESFRAIAPKRVLAHLLAEPPILNKRANSRKSQPVRKK